MSILLHANKVVDSLNMDLKTELNKHQRSVFKEIKSKVIKSIKFCFMNESLSIKDGLSIPEHLPFSEVYTELLFTSKVNHKPILCGALIESIEDRYIIYLFSMAHDCIIQNGIVNITTKGITSVKGIKKPIAPNSTEARALTVIAQQFLHNFNILNCINIEYVDNKPSRLKQNRIKKGKTKLFEHKTLQIKLNKTQNLNKGIGSHNSPRPHIRRGHIRRLPTGKIIWIQPCFINANGDGKITKDYLIK